MNGHDHAWVLNLAPANGLIEQRCTICGKTRIVPEPRWDDRTVRCPNCNKYLDDHIIAENVAICVGKTHSQPLTDEDDGA